MESGRRLVLKYFAESELRPSVQGQQAPAKPGSLLASLEGIVQRRENRVSRWARVLRENKDLLAALLTLLAAVITLALAL